MKKSKRFPKDGSPLAGFGAEPQVSYLRSVLDILFPRICPCCHDDEVDKQLCRSCWDLLALPDPAFRCRHCFADTEGFLCSTCRLSPDLCFPRVQLFDSSSPASFLRRHKQDFEEALAAWVWMFWDRFGYFDPDLVIAVPDQKGDSSIFRIAQYLAALLKRPCKKVLRRTYSGFLQPDICLLASVEENQSLLLLDVGSSLAWLKKISANIADVFPRKVVIVSLF